MKIASAETYELSIPLIEPFVISGGAITERRSLVVVLRDADGREGFGECPPFELPFYSEETLASARDLIERVLLPRIVGGEFATADDVDAALRPGIRGNPFARAGVETAAWDLEAAIAERGLADLLATRLAVTRADAVPCGVALGIPADRSLATLARWVSRAVGAGYRRVKIKVMPGWDVAAVRVAREAIGSAGLPLTVDANGSYEWPRHETELRALDGEGLLYIEQPLPPDELVGHATLAHTLSTPVCLDETLRDARAARQIEELDGPRVWNVKVHRVGGLGEVCRIWRIAQRFGATLWAGTMPESGLGSQAALAAASLPGFGYPSDLEPSERWFGRGVDVIELEMSAQGMMAVPAVPVGALLDRERFSAASRRSRST